MNAPAEGEPFLTQLQGVDYCLLPPPKTARHDKIATRCHWLRTGGFAGGCGGAFFTPRVCEKKDTAHTKALAAANLQRTSISEKGETKQFAPPPPQSDSAHLNFRTHSHTNAEAHKTKQSECESAKCVNFVRLISIMCSGAQPQSRAAKRISHAAPSSHWSHN